MAYVQAMQKANKIKESLQGYLASAIANDIANGWELAEKKRLAKITAENVALTKAEQETNLEQEKRLIEEKILLSHFESLPVDDQNTIRDQYEKNLNSFLRPIWDRVKSENQRPELDLKFQVDFFAAYKKSQNT